MCRGQWPNENPEKMANNTRPNPNTNWQTTARRPRRRRTRIGGTNSGQTSAQTRNWQNQTWTNTSWEEARRRHRRDHHHRDWWRSRYTRFALFGTGYYFWDNGYWFPAYGYDPAYNTYAYDEPIYGYNDLEPAQVIASVQTELQRLGYYRYAVDGQMGPMTRAALRDHPARGRGPGLRRQGRVERERDRQEGAVREGRVHPRPTRPPRSWRRSSR